MSHPAQRIGSDVQVGVSTDDRDEAEDAVRSVYLPNRLELLGGTAPLRMRLDALRLDAMTAGRLSYGGDVRLRTDDAREFHVNVPVRGHTVSRCGTGEAVPTEPDHAAVFLPGRPADIRWEGDCVQLCLMIPRAVVDGELEQLIGRALRSPVRFAPAMDLTTGVGRGFRAALDVVAHDFDCPPGLATHPLAARHLERLLLDGLLLGQPHNYSEALTPRRLPIPHGAVRRAVDLLEGQPARDWSTCALAREVFVSVRSLQEGFRREVGTPPMAYLQDVRLRRVHSELTRAAPGATTVSAVAFRWGFVHMGRFAAAYRATFGVTPSATLRTV
jgi:AraC-like DNA-binding protein